MDIGSGARIFDPWLTSFLLSLVFLFSGVSAFSVSSVTIMPSGTLEHGDATDISYTVYVASGTAFPSYNDLQFITPLANPVWSYSIVVNGVANERPSESGRTLTISGFELSYEDRDDVLVTVDLQGEIPASAVSGATTKLVVLQELDSRGYVINSSIVTIDHLIGTPTPTPTPSVGSITIRSDPAGADVFLDNKYKGISPLTLADLPNGDYILMVRLDGYKDADREVRIKGNSQSVKFTLKPIATVTSSISPTDNGGTPLKSGESPGSTGSLSINTTPQGAVVYIDGEMKGVTPAVIPGLSSGEHRVQLILAGYSSLNTTVFVEAGRITVYSTALAQPTKTPGFGATIAILSLLGLVVLSKRK